ncbi:MAG: hypothetical protein ABJO02_15115 [Reichenbachiella sp.]
MFFSKLGSLYPAKKMSPYALLGQFQDKQTYHVENGVLVKKVINLKLL